MAPMASPHETLSSIYTGTTAGFAQTAATKTIG